MKQEVKHRLILFVVSLSLLFAVVSGISESYKGADAAINPNLPPSKLPTNINVTNRDGAFLASYYSGTQGLTGEDLLNQLNTIIKGHREYDYENDSHRTAYKIIDRNWNLSQAANANLSSFNYTSDMPYIRKLYADYNDDILTADFFKNSG
ncbi:MAG TPA: hypothetical protein VJZ31_01755, partial [Bacilli bacterium]|nr:hypothetical protein [Bacilli bacterium]